MPDKFQLLWPAEKHAGAPKVRASTASGFCHIPRTLDHSHLAEARLPARGVARANGAHRKVIRAR